VPTVFSHAVAALALGPAFRRAAWPARVWWIAAACAMLPDADVVGFYFGVRIGSMLGHRGLTHSLAFAAAVAAILTPLAIARGTRVRLWIYLFLGTASHGALDAMTDGGIGVAFFAPFDGTRYYLPWRPIVVSPIGLRPFLSPWGLAVVTSEVIYLWLPSAAYVRARRNSEVPMPKKMTFAVHAATKGGRRSARAKASAT
jgi:inner membrane protein